MMGQSGSQRGILLGTLSVVLGLVAGAGLGFLLSQGLKFPCRSSEALARLGADSREEVAFLIAAQYGQNQDLEWARVQLERLGVPNPNLWIAALLDSPLDGERDTAELHALAQLAQELGVDSPAILAYQATATAAAPSDTPLPTATIVPSLTATPMASPTATPEDTAMPVPTDTALPTDTATAIPPTKTVPTDTPILPTPTSEPSDTPVPPTPTAPPPTAAPPTVAPPPAAPAAKWTWTARLLGPGEDAQTCATGHKLIRVTVLDAAGNQIPGQWVYEKQYTGQYRVTGHKGDDPFWGPGEAEFSQLDGGRLCIATGEGGDCESELTRDLSCYAPPPLDDLWAAGYCGCCEPDITKERCQELIESETDQCIWYVHYAWHVEFRRSW